MTPTFQRPREVDRLLESLFAGNPPPDEVIVVDNDPRASYQARWASHWPVRVVHAGLGLNLAGARNRGWRITQSELCVFIDDDNTVASHTLAALWEAALGPGVGLVAPVIYEANRPSRIWCAGVTRSMWTTRTRFAHRGLSELPAAESWSTDDMPDAFAIPRKVLESVGGFDEMRFPFHYDEADIGERIRRQGLRLIVVRKATVWHAGGNDMDLGREVFRAYELSGESRVQFMAYARVYFHRRYSRSLQRVTALAVFVPLHSLVVAIACMRLRKPLRLKLTIVRAILRGLKRGYTFG